MESIAATHFPTEPAAAKPSSHNAPSSGWHLWNSSLVRGRPHQLGVVADLVEVVARAAVGEEVLLQPPGLDGEQPRHQVGGDEDVLPAGAEVLRPPPGGVVVLEDAAAAGPATGVGGRSLAPRLEWQKLRGSQPLSHPEPHFFLHPERPVIVWKGLGKETRRF